MHPLASAILITWRRNRDYAARLVGDLTDGQMLAQPVPGVMMNHPAWILSHLNVYAPNAAAMLRRQSFADPLDHPHGQQSKPLDDPAAYLPRAELLARYLMLHDEAQAALEAADPAVFEEETPIPRWREKHPRKGEMLVTLMVKHEAGHLGQLSAWRRAMRLPGVPM